MPTMTASPYLADSATYRPDRFYLYAHLTELLETWTRAHPHLASLSPIGRTYEGRDRDARLLVPRAPYETGGQYYWLLPEGRLSDHDPARDGLLGEVKSAVTPFGLDLNRNFPAHWKPDSQGGGGEFPLSEPEARALATFMMNHRNIAGSQHYHTFSGVILRPSTVRSDAQWNRDDLNR